MPHTPHNETNPLLDAEGKSRTELSNKPISSTLWATNTLSYLRIATGAACLVAPQFTCALFKWNVPMGSTLLVRMAGSRDGVLGGLLLTAEDKNAPDGGGENSKGQFGRTWLQIPSTSGAWCMLSRRVMWGSQQGGYLVPELWFSWGWVRGDSEVCKILSWSQGLNVGFVRYTVQCDVHFQGCSC